MNIQLIQYPTEDTWLEVKQRCLVTVGKKSKIAPDMVYKKKLLRARHSPIRHIIFSFYIEGVPSWVATHLARHVHALPFIKSQRNDRQSDYDRNAARQDSPVNMMYEVNAEELITICEKRLCMQAAEETRTVVKEMKRLVLAKCPEFEWVLNPVCVKHKYCDEMFPCPKGVRLQAEEEKND